MALREVVAGAFGCDRTGAQDVEATDELEMMLGNWLSAPLPIHIVYPLNRNLSNKVRVFVEWVAELFARDERLMLHSPLPMATEKAVEPIAFARGRERRLREASVFSTRDSEVVRRP